MIKKSSLMGIPCQLPDLPLGHCSRVPPSCLPFHFCTIIIIPLLLMDNPVLELFQHTRILAADFESLLGPDHVYRISWIKRLQMILCLCMPSFSKRVKTLSCTYKKSSYSKLTKNSFFFLLLGGMVSLSPSQFHDYACAKCYDILSKGRYKKFLGQSRAAGEEWALKTVQSVQSVQLSVDAIQKLMDKLPSWNNAEGAVSLAILFFFVFGLAAWLEIHGRNGVQAWIVQHWPRHACTYWICHSHPRREGTCPLHAALLVFISGGRKAWR